MKPPPPPTFEVPPEPDWENPKYRKWYEEKFLTDEDRAFHAQLTPQQCETMFTDEWLIADLERERQRIRKGCLRSGLDVPPEDSGEWTDISNLKTYIKKYRKWLQRVSDEKNNPPK